MYDEIKALTYKHDDLLSYNLRRNFTENYSWAIPSEETIDEIVSFVGNDTVLEIGSGSGLWASLLHEKGVNIIATDSYLSHAIHGKFFNVEKLKHSSALKKYSTANVLMLCWPPYDDQMAQYCLLNFKGKKVVYIGESVSGCNATYAFFHTLDRNFDCEITDSLQQWDGIHDNLWLCTKKDKS